MPARELVIALRTDANGVAPGLKDTNDQTAAFVEQQKRYAAEVAAAWGKARGGQAGQPAAADKPSTQALQESQQAAVKGEMAIRNEHATTAAYMRDLDARYYATLYRDQQSALQESQNYYERLAQQDREYIEKVNRNMSSPAGGGGGGSGGGGGGGFSQGWMRRMAGMEISRDVGNLISPGLGDELGPAGYFAGGAMFGIGAAVVGAGLLVKEYLDIPQGIIASKQEQIQFNAEIDKANAKYAMLAERTVKFSQFGEQARSQFESASSSMADAAARVAKAQIDYDYAGIFDHKEKAMLDSALRDQAAAQGQGLIAGIDLYGPNFTTSALQDAQSRMAAIRAQTHGGRATWAEQNDQYKADVLALEDAKDIQAQMQTITGGRSRSDIERQYAEADARNAALEEQHRTAEALSKSRIAGMFPGRFQQRAGIEADYAAQQSQLADKAHDELIALQRQRDQAARDIGVSFLAQHTDKTTGALEAGYNLQNDQGYQAQLAATQKYFDLEAQRTAAEQRGAEDRAGIEHDAATARINLDQQTYDRQLADELRMAQIAGEGDPYKRRIDDQNALNEKRLIERIYAGDTLGDLWKQLQTMWQLSATLQRDVDLERTMLGIRKQESDLQDLRIYDKSWFGGTDANLANQQRLLQAGGMTKAARDMEIEREKNEAARDWQEASRVWQQVKIDQGALAAAQKSGKTDDINDARQKLAHDLAEANAAQQQAREADQRWGYDKLALQREHARSVQNELQSVLDATSVAENWMTRLQADRRAFEREHPDERSKAELDAFYAAKQGQVNADFGRSIMEKELDIASRYGLMNPMEADYRRMKLEHPDVSNSLLKEMAMLDRIAKGGELSTKYTMGQTNFAALRGEIIYGGAPPSWARGQGAGDYPGGPFDGASAVARFDSARGSASSVFDGPLRPGGSRSLSSQDSNNPVIRTNQILSRMESILRNIEALSS
jgi:hypothetical protein